MSEMRLVEEDPPEESASLRASIGVDDSMLMSRIVDGDAEALGAVFDRHGGAAYSLASRILGRADDAEDVTQEAFVLVWRKALRFDPGLGSLRSWILTVVRNRAIDELRRNDVRPALDLDDGTLLERHSDAQADVHREVALVEAQEKVHLALARLPDEQKQAIGLAYFGGLSHREVAAEIGIPEGTAKGRIRLGLEHLRFALADTDLAPDGRD